MRILAGGPARETTSEMFKLHLFGLEAQCALGELGDLVTIRHDIVADGREDPDLENDRWPNDVIQKVAKARQKFMDTDDYDALFMADTDLIMGPGVLRRMLRVDADVVYGVFWTMADWAGTPTRACPQVWNVNPYGWTNECAAALHEKGINEVPVLGGGACTLIRGRGFESRYWPLLQSLQPYGNMFCGEDRTYALGLECRDIKQIAVTGLPIAHAYHDDQKTLRALEEARRLVGL